MHNLAATLLTYKVMQFAFVGMKKEKRGLLNVKPTSGAGVVSLECDSFGKTALNGVILY